jgi:hypothetical protein
MLVIRLVVESLNLESESKSESLTLESESKYESPTLESESESLTNRHVRVRVLV